MNEDLIIERGGRRFKWVSNYGTDDIAARAELVPFHSDNPKPTAKYTLMELREMGMRGAYKEIGPDGNF